MAKKKNKDGLIPGEAVTEADFIRVSLNHRNKNKRPEKIDKEEVFSEIKQYAQ